MGKNKRFNNGSTSFHQKRKKRRELNKRIANGETQTRKADYDTTKVLENEMFLEYYKKQFNLESEDFNRFIECAKTDLPASFRICATSFYRNQLLKFMEPYFDSKGGIKVSKIAWCPNAFKLNTCRKTLRKSDDPEMRKLHQFLVREAKTQNITRQEEVSMIPPTVLDIQPHHRVLDTCAAPGSKTAQMLEFITAGQSQEDVGYLVANDCDARRAYMLHHQLKRFKTGCANLVITNLEAQFFPRSIGNKVLEFDRILCDVPCSGDGTIRKNIDIWRTFSTTQTLALHPLQINIALKAAQLLAEGGKLVYSTCSLSPIEDEAVVAQLLRLSQGALELCKVELKGLKWREGLPTWHVATTLTEKVVDETTKAEKQEHSLKWWDSIEDFEKFRSENKTPKNGGKYQFAKRLHPSMFPPSEEEAKTFNLDRCIRVLPHDQDSGGFFVCVLKKVKALPRWYGPITSLKSLPKTEEKSEEDRTEKHTPILMKSDRISRLPKFASHYSISKEDFQSLSDDIEVKPELAHQLITRRDTQKNNQETQDAKKSKNKVIFYCGKRIIQDFLDDEMIQGRLNILGCGVPIFKRNDRYTTGKDTAMEKHRIAGDGVNLLAPWVNSFEKKLIKVSLEQLDLFLDYCLYKPSSTEAKSGKSFCPGIPCNLLGMEDGKDIENFRMESCLLQLDNNSEEKIRKMFDLKEDEFSVRIVVWRGKSSISQLVGISDLEVLKQQLEFSELLPQKTEEEVAKLSKELEAYFVEMNAIKLRKAEVNETKTVE